MSSLLFNSVLHFAMEDDLKAWREKTAMVIKLGDEQSDCISSLRFADDLFYSCYLPVSEPAQKDDDTFQDEYRENGT